MDTAQITERVTKILEPYVKDAEAFASLDGSTRILDDLKVNSARLVDVILAFEDAFDIEIADEDVDGVETLDDCVRLIGARIGA